MSSKIFRISIKDPTFSILATLLSWGSPSFVSFSRTRSDAHFPKNAPTFSRAETIARENPETTGKIWAQPRFRAPRKILAATPNDYLHLYSRHRESEFFFSEVLKSPKVPRWENKIFSSAVAVSTAIASLAAD